MDLDHARAKPPGTVRVGFFGDSYVESVQLPLDETFFRQLAGAGVEPLAFGVSGWGTLHAFRAAQHYAPAFGLDEVVYVFVENDPADSSYLIQARKRRSPLLLAESSAAPPGYTLRWGTPPGAEAAWLPVAKTLQQRSLLAQLVLVRLRLLRGTGIQIRRRDGDAQMTARGRPEDDPAALPTTWAPELRAEAARVTEAILRDWSGESARAGRRFAVLYVPRNEDQLTGRLAESETWLPWLRDVCTRNAIRLVDPSEALAARVREGVHVYDDHWSPAGHTAIAQLVAGELALSSASRSSARAL
jgi:hypothetical protein